MIPDKLKGKRAIAYLRVSTTDQKDHGFSLASQRDRITSFCEQHGIILVLILEEDYSAKTFNRPQFNKLTEIAVQNKKGDTKIDFVLVTAWDRFSRQLTETSIMIEQFSTYGIEVNCIQDWKNLKSSSDFLSHSFQMTFAEYENRLRSERVKDGNYKALEDGRYTSKPPIGYLPSKDVFGKPLMIPDPNTAHHVTTLLEDYSTGKYSQNELINKYKAKGFKITKSTLSRMLSSSIYCAKNKITDPRTEKEKVVRMIHQPLIDESTFERNQHYLNKKNRIKEKTSKDREELPLRGGLLLCPECNRSMTGYPRPKSNGKTYFYYNCCKRYGCGKVSFNADKPHQVLQDELSKITISTPVMKLFEHILMEQYKSMYQTREEERETFIKRKQEVENKIYDLTEKWIDEKIKGGQAVYDRMYDKYESELKDLDEQLALIPLNDESPDFINAPPKIRFSKILA